MPVRHAPFSIRYICIWNFRVIEPFPLNYNNNKRIKRAINSKIMQYDKYVDILISTTISSGESNSKNNKIIKRGINSNSKTKRGE